MAAVGGHIGPGCAWHGKITCWTAGACPTKTLDDRASAGARSALCARDVDGRTRRAGRRQCAQVTPRPPNVIVRGMLSRRSALLSSSAALAARSGSMPLCLHQTTSAAAGYRRSLEGYAKAGIRYVEVIPQHVEEFVKQDGMPAAKRLLSDLGLKAVSSGGVRGLAEPGPARAKALGELRARGRRGAGLGESRMVCPCATADKL